MGQFVECPLYPVKQTIFQVGPMSACDPKRTSRSAEKNVRSASGADVFKLAQKPGWHQTFSGCTYTKRLKRERRRTPIIPMTRQRTIRLAVDLLSNPEFFWTKDGFCSISTSPPSDGLIRPVEGPCQSLANLIMIEYYFDVNSRFGDWEWVALCPLMTQSGHYRVWCKGVLECPIPSARTGSRYRRGQLERQSNLT